MDISDVYALQTLRATDSEGHDTYFRELFIFRGGVEIGNPQTGGVLEEYSSYYAIHVQEQDLSIHYWQKVNGVWGEIDPDLLPDLTTAQVGDRRFGAALDQNQRIIVSFERAGSIKVTRWNGSAYVQDVSFTGINPAIFAEGLAARYIPGSDVVIFYQKTDDMSKIYTRLSSENFTIEREHIDYSEDIILDKVIYNRNDPYRFQILIADANGEKFYLDDDGENLQGLRSQLYPVRTYQTLDAGMDIDVYKSKVVVYQYSPYTPYVADMQLDLYELDTLVYIYNPESAYSGAMTFDEFFVDPTVYIYNPYTPLDVSMLLDEYVLAEIAYAYYPYTPYDASMELDTFILETV